MCYRTLVKIFGLLLLCNITVIGCEQERVHQEPYSLFSQMGLFGHGQGFIGELNINIWGLPRRCDSCHAVSQSIHGDLGTCNSCHQPHLSGWKHATVALQHDQSLVLIERDYHFKLKCTQCHAQLSSRRKYKQAECISCHNHSRYDIQYAHELMDEFDMTQEYKDHRCISCHAKTGKEYLQYYDPVTNEFL